MLKCKSVKCGTKMRAFVCMFLYCVSECERTRVHDYVCPRVFIYNVFMCETVCVFEHVCARHVCYGEREKEYE